MFWKGQASDLPPKIRVTEVADYGKDGSTFIDLGFLGFERITGDNIKGYEEIHGWKNWDIEADSCLLQLAVAGGKQGLHVCAIPRIAVLIWEGEQKIICTTGEERIFKEGDLILFTDVNGRGHGVEFIRGGLSIIWANPILPPLTSS